MKPSVVCVMYIAILVQSILVFPAMAMAKPQTTDMSGDLRLMRQAQTAFRENDFGAALKFAEQAKQERKRIIRWQYATVNNSFKASEVKRAHGILTDIIPILQEREEYDSISIIQLYQRRLSPSYLKDKAENLVDFLSHNDAFPEADCLIARIYRLEGEYALSRQYLLYAWENASLLDIEDEQYDILYELAEICSLQGDMDGYEKNLLLVLKDSNTFADEGLKNALLTRIRGGKPNDMEKFFLLFRSEDYRSIKAYGLLSSYYQDVGETQKALVASSLGVLTGFTKIYDIIRSRDPEFEYKGLQSLFTKMTEYNDIMEWADEERIWHEFNEFAMRISGEGRQFAIDLLTIMCESAPQAYWREQATEFLSNINGEGGNHLKDGY